MNPVKLTLSISDLRKADACNLGRRIADLNAQLGREAAEDEAIDLGIWLSLPSTSHDDAIWSLRAAQPKTDAIRVSVFVAKAAADRVAHLLSPAGQADAARAAAAYAAYARIAEAAAHDAAYAYAAYVEAATAAARAAYAAAYAYAADAVDAAAAAAAAARAAYARDAAADAAKAASRAELLSVLL